MCHFKRKLKNRVGPSVLHGPGLGPRAGPARSPWAWPGRAWIIFCGPGRVRAWNLKARAGPGPVNINFAGRGPGLGLTFPGLGRARAYSESHYYSNIMVKDYLHLSIAKDHCFICCKCNCTKGLSRCMTIYNSVQGRNMRKIKVVVLLVRQLQHGFTKNAKVSPNLTVAHLVKRYTGTSTYNCVISKQSWKIG